MVKRRSYSIQLAPQTIWYGKVPAETEVSSPLDEREAVRTRWWGYQCLVICGLRFNRLPFVTR